MSTCRVFLRSKCLYYPRLWCRLGRSPRKESFVTRCMCCMMLIGEKPVGAVSTCLEARCVVVPSHSALYIGSRLCSTTRSLSPCVCVCIYTTCLCAYVSWTVALAILISPRVIRVSARACVYVLRKYTPVYYFMRR